MEAKLFIKALFEFREKWMKEHPEKAFPMRYISPRSFELLNKAIKDDALNIVEVEETDVLYRVRAVSENEDHINFSIPKSFFISSEEWLDVIIKDATREHIELLENTICEIEKIIEEKKAMLVELKKEKLEYEQKYKECVERVYERYGEGDFSAIEAE